MGALNGIIRQRPCACYVCTVGRDGTLRTIKSILSIYTITTSPIARSFISFQRLFFSPLFISATPASSWSLKNIFEAIKRAKQSQSTPRRTHLSINLHLVAWRYFTRAASKQAEARQMYGSLLVNRLHPSITPIRRPGDATVGIYFEGRTETWPEGRAISSAFLIHLWDREANPIRKCSIPRRATELHSPRKGGAVMVDETQVSLCCLGKVESIRSVPNWMGARGMSHRCVRRYRQAVPEHNICSLPLQRLKIGKSICSTKTGVIWRSSFEIDWEVHTPCMKWRKRPVPKWWEGNSGVLGGRNDLVRVPSFEQYRTGRQHCKWTIAVNALVTAVYAIWILVAARKRYCTGCTWGEVKFDLPYCSGETIKKGTVPQHSTVQ